MVIKSFRGLIVDASQQSIPLQTNNGLTGYRIVKFQVMPFDIDGSSVYEASVTIWKVPQATVSNDVDFSNNQLLGAAYYIRTTSGGGTPTAVFDNQSVIFDNEVFNQDIYVAYEDGQTSNKINYYIELEQINLSLDEATVATLKDIRNKGSQ